MDAVRSNKYERLFCWMGRCQALKVRELYRIHRCEMLHVRVSGGEGNRYDRKVDNLERHIEEERTNDRNKTKRLSNLH